MRGNEWDLGHITVDDATSDLTATAGIEYQATSGTLKFSKDETVKALTVPLLQPRAPEGAKSFRVTLSRPSGAARLGISSATVDIVGTYFTLAPAFDTALAIRSDQGVHTLTWTGGGTLQRADSVAGPWQALTHGRSPYSIQPPLPGTFYQVARPRPVSVYVPSRYDGQTPLPLVILPHAR